MSRNTLVLLAAAGSLGLIIAVFFFQYIGYPPCRMCIWQRWPHAVAVVIGAFALVVRGRVLPVLGGLAALVTAGLGVYHTGVERDWWEGPASCTGTGGLDGLSGADLLSTADGPALVMCDQVTWAVAGLSMASWNAIVSLLLALIWFAAAARSRL